jgi:hypothetical protein
MRLGGASQDDVVQNTGNRSFYRFERLERGRARIRPLELFPNGRLMPKPTDTLVDADLVVALVGPWAESMVVEGAPTHGRAHYEKELQERVELLSSLEADYDLLPKNGVGRQSRGSWANKVKNCKARIETLQAGLAEPEAGAEIRRAAREDGPADLGLRDLVQLPSGRPGLILGFEVVGRVRYATVRCRAREQAADDFDAAMALLEAPVPVDVLRPWSTSALCTT